MIWSVLAVAVIVVHFGFLLFVVFGGFLAWRWPRVVWLHLAALAWAAGSVVVHYDCPLTTIEDSFLRRAGDHPDGQFVDRYVKGYVVPHGHDRALQMLAALVIAVSYVGFMRRRRARRAPAPAGRVAAPAPGTSGGTTP